MSRSKIIAGERFIEALQRAGILPDHTVSVRIAAAVGSPVTLDYEVLGDTRLVTFAESLEGAREDMPGLGIVR